MANNNRVKLNHFIPLFFLWFVGSPQNLLAACSDNPMLKNHGVTTDYVKESSSKTTTYIDDVPEGTVTGIEKLYLNDSKLLISVTSKTLHHEYTAPTINTVQLTKYEAKPISSAVATTLLLGLPLLLAPGKTLESTFGCVDREMVSTEPDKSKAIKTNNKVWRDANPKTLSIKITGLETVITETINLDEKRTATIDLLNDIMSSNLTTPSTLKIECVSCQNSLPSSDNSNADIKLAQTITADFRLIKEREINLLMKAEAQKIKSENERAKQLKADEDERQRLEKEAERQRIIEEAKERSARKRQEQLRKQEQEKLEQAERARKLAQEKQAEEAEKRIRALKL